MERDGRGIEMSAEPPRTGTTTVADAFASTTANACPTTYESRSLEATLGGRRVLGPLDLRIDRGSFLGIVGPNGSGKTTLLRVLTGAVKPSNGAVLLNGHPLQHYSALDLAREVAVVPQQFSLDFNFTVAETVAMGRYARGDDDVDSASVTAALSAVGLTDLAARLITRLSGGERQRAVIAQALSQETPALLLDEPLNNLDLNHQLEVMQLLTRLHADGKTIIVVLHDLNMAAQYCHEILLLDGGRAAARGAPGDILDPHTILEVFKVRVAVHRQGSRPYLTPLWTRTPECNGDTGGKQVHVVAGGGAATHLIEELVLHGFAPTVGVVSVFDTDYATAQKYELKVVSSPPFEPFPPEAVQEAASFAGQAEVIIIAPVFFGKGNLAPLRVALQMARAGKRVMVIDQPPIEERDMSGGEATLLMAELMTAGALEISDPAKAIEQL
ncbi:MAG: ABC transporter ATP-binding protein [Thermoleophilia bacterium]|nr:ABC transporter ATP-binding protein [Thermoleophilia bacterium]